MLLEEGRVSYAVSSLLHRHIRAGDCAGKDSPEQPESDHQGLHCAARPTVREARQHGTHSQKYNNETFV